jgi:SCY1-like protein 1
MDPVHEDPIPEAKITKPASTPKPKPKPIATAKTVPAPVVTNTNVDVPFDPARAQSPTVSITPPEKPATPLVNLASMSKEEKEKEMARRREERKAVSVPSLLSFARALF